MDFQVSSLDNFMKQYEEAANSKDFKNVEGLISQNAVYWFSDGSYRGMKSIRQAFERTWKTVVDEEYRISDFEWIVRSEASAVCIYTFSSKGYVNGELFKAMGRGTNVIVMESGAWKVVHEHLSPDK